MHHIHPIELTFPLTELFSYYQGGGFPITKEGRLKFGYRGRKVKFPYFCVKMHILTLDFIVHQLPRSSDEIWTVGDSGDGCEPRNTNMSQTDIHTPNKVH